MTPATLAEALAMCEAQKLGPSSCAELVSPFCGGRGVVMAFGEPVRCVAEGGASSDRKAAVLLAEAEAARRSGPPWLAIGAVAGLLGIVAWYAMKE